MKKRLEEYDLDWILPILRDKSAQLHYFQAPINYEVDTSSSRITVFAEKGCTCVKCGIKGSFFAMEINGNKSPHLNLYAKTRKGEILMTRDHILPKSKGGNDSLENSQPMCEPCNSRKGNNIETT